MTPEEKQFEKALKFLELSQNDTLTPKELEAFANVLMTFFTKTKEDFDGISSKSLKDVEDLIVAFKASAAKSSSAISQAVGDALEECRQLYNQILATKPKDGLPGVSPDPEQVALRASQIAEETLKPMIPTVELLINDLPKFGSRIRDGLELLPDGEKLSIDAIEGLREELAVRNKPNVNNQGGSGSIAGRDVFKDYDLSTQLDGVTATFNLPAVWNIISVALSSYPYGSLRKNIDYTWTPTSITFTANIDPATQLAVGQQCVLTIVSG